jgi:NTP pyrophosphatase (non-canonical NTP hydrolase)/nucleoside 2-deoxyribosyltransferase
MAMLEITDPAHLDTALRVVLCGSFRRDPDGLASTFATLQSHFHVLSPHGLNFVDSSAEFVRLPREVGQRADTIEARHLEAMTTADFVWLHAPGGYVGTSAAMELGHAAALGIPVFGTVPPSDEVLASLVHLVATPRDITADVLVEATRPGRGISRLQAYYATTSERRGWADESANETLTRLAGEVAELTLAIKKASAGVRPEDDRDADVAAELADVQLYLVHLASALGLDLASAVTAKERLNASRFAVRRTTAA